MIVNVGMGNSTCISPDNRAVFFVYETDEEQDLF
jgi:hypothetical protein